MIIDLFGKASHACSASLQQFQHALWRKCIACFVCACRQSIAVLRLLQHVLLLLLLFDMCCLSQLAFQMPKVGCHNCNVWASLWTSWGTETNPPADSLLAFFCHLDINSDRFEQVHLGNQLMNTCKQDTVCMWTCHANAMYVPTIPISHAKMILPV